MTTPEANNTPRIDLEPQEGIDYIVDYYAALGLEPDASSEKIKSTALRIIKENHPDRLEGMDEKLARQGRAKTELATKAREILLNVQHRNDYDEILANWEGLISKNGTPVDSPELWSARRARAMSTDELEGAFDATRSQIEAAVGYSSKRVSVLKKLIDMSGDDIDAETREEYDTALLSQDRVFAIEQTSRAVNLGMSDGVIKAGFGHMDAIESGITQGRVASLENARALEASNIRGRLALMAGADIEPVEGERLPAQIEPQLPSWFEDQAQKVREIAKQREDILTERLRNMAVEYPQAEMQTDSKGAFVLGIEFPDKTLWLGFSYDQENGNAEQIEMAPTIEEQLMQGEYVTVIDSGYNVAKVKPLEEVEIMTILEAALGKHVDKYFLQDEDVE